MQVASAKEKIEEGITRLKELNTRYETEITALKNREQDAWSQLEQSQTDLTAVKSDYENKMADLHAKALEDKNTMETMNLKIMASESSSKDIDIKVNVSAYFVTSSLSTLKNSVHF